MFMEDKIVFSIITPVYNRSDCIGRCLDSVVKAIKKYTGTGDFTSIEHVVVDDGSFDTTASIVESYLYKYPHIKFIKFESNKGTNAARNAAIKAASGKMCVILDSDDYFRDTALIDMISVVRKQPEYRHYMFSPDDMQPYYNDNPYLKGCEQKVLTYSDFLSGNINFDFIHVCDREILLKYPFDENLRVYEGVFFLLFYKEAQKMLFTNKVVTIRERNREDSVSLETIRTSVNVIKRNMKSNELKLEYFQDDLIALGMKERLYAIRLSLLENYVLMERYEQAQKLVVQMRRPKNKRDLLLRVFYTFRSGKLLCLLLRSFLSVKYHLLKKDMKVG